MTPETVAYILIGLVILSCLAICISGIVSTASKDEKTKDTAAKTALGLCSVCFLFTMYTIVKIDESKIMDMAYLL